MGLFSKQRDPARMYPILMELFVVWGDEPDTRFGQLLSNFEHYVRTVRDRDIFNVEDDEMRVMIREYKQYKDTARPKREAV